MGVKIFYKYNFIIKLIIIIFSLTINTVYADGGWIVRPYLGLEYKLSYTEAEDSWNRLLPTNKLNNNGTIFYGIYFHNYIASEISYTQSNSHTKYSDLSGWNMFGAIAGSGTQQDIKLSYTNYSFDLNCQYPGMDGFALLGTVGISAIKPKLEITNQGAVDSPLLNSNGTIALDGNGNPTIVPGNEAVTTMTGKSQVALRLGVGLQYTKGIVSIRSRVMWEDASKLRVNVGSYNQLLPNITETPFQNTFAWTLGIFIRIL